MWKARKIWSWCTSGLQMVEYPWGKARIILPSSSTIRMTWTSYVQKSKVTVFTTINNCKRPLDSRTRMTTQQYEYEIWLTTRTTTRSRVATAMAFSRQNDAGSRTSATYYWENFVLVLGIYWPNKRVCNWQTELCQVIVSQMMFYCPASARSIIFSICNLVWFCERFLYIS